LLADHLLALAYSLFGHYFIENPNHKPNKHQRCQIAYCFRPTHNSLPNLKEKIK
jgi:hypothetical protein